MQKIPRQNYKYYYFKEEKKEDNFNENNNLYSNIQIEGIKKDLKNKGYNDFQIKDIISSIQKNNNIIQKDRVGNYNNNIEEIKIPRIKRGQGLKIKVNNNLKKETEIKQRNEYNKFNTKIYISNNLSEKRDIKSNNFIPKRKISERMNLQNNNKSLFSINNDQIISREKANNSNINILYDCENIIKRKKVATIFNDSKNKFNNYSFYDSKEKKVINNQIKNGIQENINNYNYKGKKILKYRNRKPKKVDFKIGNKSLSNQIIKINENDNVNQIPFPKSKPKTIENTQERKNNENKDSKDDINVLKKAINRHSSLRQLKNNVCFKNIQFNSYSINKNSEIDKKNKNKIIFCEYKPAKTQIDNIESYNNYMFHDISNEKNDTNINNTKKYFIKHYYSNACLKKNKKSNHIYKQINKINNSLNNIKEPIKEIKTIKLDKNVKVVRKKSSYNNISKKVIYDLNFKPKKVRENSHNAINTLNIEHNTISLVIEPSYQKNDENAKNIRDKKNFEENKNNLKVRNNSENKQLTVFKIENQKEINYVARRKKYKDGQYEGIIINGKRELRGIMNYKNGGKYEGQWKNDKRHGKGVFISQNYNNPNLMGIKYEGEFNNDKIEGYGIGKYSSGDTYEGEWKNNKQYGRGVLNYVGGGKYVGEWKNGKLNGEGIYYLKNGERFEGKFLDNKYDGYGNYYYNNGEYLEGIFKDDLPSGDCILHKVAGGIEVKHYD